MSAYIEGARRRIVIEAISPSVDGGRFSAKAIVGRAVDVEADVFADGHDHVGALLRWRRAADATWRDLVMTPIGNDRFAGTFTPHEPGEYRFVVQGWIDAYATWRADLLKWLEAGDDLLMELRAGAPLVAAAARRAGGTDRERLRAWRRRLEEPSPGEAAELATAEELAALMARNADRRRGGSTSAEFPIWVDRERAGCGAWYELFPRSSSPTPGRHGTLRDVATLVPSLHEAGFDVLYLPPIHPIGMTGRKGANNRTQARPGEPGSPWAIGSAEGGHTALHPDLGTLDDLEHLRKELDAHDMELALDLAFQCSPDHPWVGEHPEWFRRRPDGSIRFAENPPKRYEDVYPIDFETKAWRELWDALLGVTMTWLERGIRIFRVDNPHTKPFAFWEWLIANVHEADPGVLFLAEAFTRPKVMYRLAKLGFTQSYTYFAWRRTSAELSTYFNELTSPPVADFFRSNLWPNTPDILTEELQTGGPPAFRMRLLLAATLGANYGIYGPAFEHWENEPREPGSEEYRDSEKFQLRWRDPAGAAGMRERVTVLNAIRRAHPALQQDRTLRFHGVDNERLLAYSKRDDRTGDVVLVIVNLDPGFPQAGWTDLDMPALGLAWDAAFAARDLITTRVFPWRGRRNYVELHPARQPGHVLELTATEAVAVARSEERAP